MAVAPCGHGGTDYTGAMNRVPSWVFAALAASLLACGSSSSAPSGSASDASTDAITDGAALVDSGVDAPPVPAPPDPGKLVCGTDACTVPGAVCCYSSLAPGGAADHCAAGQAVCGAPNDECDETADCAAGQVCCTGVAALPQDASVGGFESTFCIDESSPGSCIPRAGVANSSVQACKTDAECKNGRPCTVQRCFGRVLETCGPDPECK
jgi:hypothetical protein